MKPATSLPKYTWVGLLIMSATQALLALDVPLAATWLTPLMWTGYFAFVDGLVYRLGGASWLTTRVKEFPLLAILSVGVWLLFEAYNLYLQNWVYAGLPARAIVRNIGYFWSFATIMPGVFATSELVEILLRRRASRRPRVVVTGPAWSWFALGTAMVTIPLSVPFYLAALLFGAVWIGFFLLLDPLNERLGTFSLRAQLRKGDWMSLAALLIGGLLCGFLWEAWNYQAFLKDGAYWIYTFPALLRPLDLQFGQMPVLGLLGFPPFALELAAFYAFLRELLGGDRIFGRFTFLSASGEG